MTFKQIGIDIGKNSFHVVGLGADGDIVLRKQFTRSRLLAVFRRSAQRVPACSI
ncbi:hypothetical protein VSX64_19530 [Aurantimonas sp. C2-6-R+9]|uniref:hypothetical protein n=1 Tax=unclassified Aurantimonas TaxID=2638230 RepID=UPI002E175CB2|nr:MULTISPECIES: hypothetical protein [unclassified Aurantimonas]MEC5292836.1 hypothetical protein [Aurantimonas sp. C2-3-R2]MEC5383030.1 hypothetical protein [Aurantimonas sp. C2-6-R+9]MEC5413884.1 hypothetical protein [Aurantimonas sp. C2-4-R8]